ncbi:hypothetical protein C1H46_021932 [Malus baccata]|uniref:Uncharacterized protein n=1 Tax=Malus baccata TaxID=106549 RepID=A0A540M1E8_MALBA|nr:hypothetical protein C1H46_021932 [Malus baccata]
MAPSKLAILSIFLALIFSQIRADMKVPDEENERPSFPVKINELGSPDSWRSKWKAKFHDLEKRGRRLFGGKAKGQNKNEQSENGASPGKAYLHGNSGM